MTEAHAPSEHKAPAKKRATRKKAVVHHTHAELELIALNRKLTAIYNAMRHSFPHFLETFNDQQVKALEKKIAKRERTIALEQQRAAAKAAA